MKLKEYAQLITEDGERFSGSEWNIYPRPQFVRDSFFCLNGEWDFAVCDGETIEPESIEKIIVPFCPESLISGVNRTFDSNTRFFYKREFYLPEGFVKSRVILHFGAVDAQAEVFLNGSLVGTHCGGYNSFSFDVTEFLRSQNVLTVYVNDHLNNGDFSYPYGKQCKNRGGMWYTQVSGIWQTVWLESVGENYIRSLKIDADVSGADITVVPALDGRVYVQTEQGELCFDLQNGRAKVELENPRLWSPETPYLYRFSIKTADDEVDSYFALRTLEIKEVNSAPTLCLNGKPYFFHALLDQGYFPEGIYTPVTPAAYEKDILAMKSLGFNTLRKHIKVESEQFYYDCDRLGMVVFQDMVNNGDYKFFRDTALPTIALKRLNDRRMHRDKRTRERFIECMRDTVSQLYNHPSICLWTIFNEGWGQFCSDEMYDILKSFDSSRFVDSTSGWFWNKKTDVMSHHVYFKKYKYKKSKKPVIVSEFGGYSHKVAGHIFNLSKNYGYGIYKTISELQNAIYSLYEEQIIPAAKKGLCAAVYTQVSDVEDETNGLLTYDRKVLKVEQGPMRKIAERLSTAKQKQEV